MFHAIQITVGWHFSQEDKVSFNLKLAKELVFKEYTEGAPGRFKKFISTPLFDRLLHTCILLFVSRFQIEALHRSIEKYLRLKDDDKAAAAEQRIHLLEEEVQHYRADMAPLYGSILMTYSDYKNPHQVLHWTSNRVTPLTLGCTHQSRRPMVATVH